MPLPNDATLEQIEAALENMTGINEKSEMITAIKAKGGTLPVNPTYFDLVQAVMAFTTIETKSGDMAVFQTNKSTFNTQPTKKTAFQVLWQASAGVVKMSAFMYGNPGATFIGFYRNNVELYQRASSTGDAVINWDADVSPGDRLSIKIWADGSANAGVKECWLKVKAPNMGVLEVDQG